MDIATADPPGAVGFTRPTTAAPAPAGEPAVPAKVPLWVQWREPLAIAALVLGIKILIFAVGILCYEVYMNQRIVWPMGFFDLWNHWDSPHYLALAEKGYQADGEDASNLAFLPLYPLLIRFLMGIGIPSVVAAFLISGVASVAAAILLYYLARRDFAPKESRNAVWFFLIFPTAFVLHIGMTESLFLALVLGSFYAARRRAWGYAGCLAFLASLTRLPGLWLVPALLWEAWDEYRETRRVNRLWPWILVGALGLGVYLALNYRVTGDPFGFMRYQRAVWFHTFAPPWIGIRDTFRSVTWHEPSNIHTLGWAEGIYSLIGLWAVVLAARRLRWSYAIWACGNWLMFTSLNFLISVPRYTLALFPLFLLWGRLPTGSMAHRLLTAWSLLFLSVYIGLWAQGRWAF